MANDLISRSKLQFSLKRQPSKLIDCKHYIMLDIALGKVQKAPSVDAVEVVRCRECVGSSICDDVLVCERIRGIMDGYYRGTAEVVNPDDYCSHGVAQRSCQR